MKKAHLTKAEKQAHKKARQDRKSARGKQWASV